MGWDTGDWIGFGVVVVALVVMHLMTRKIRRTVAEYATVDLEVIHEMRLMLHDMASIRPELDETIEVSLATLDDQERKLQRLLKLTLTQR